MQAGYVVVDDFFDGAEELRAGFEAHFRDPDSHGHAHQVWNYWYVPETYTYLRTRPDKVVPPPLVARFLDRLNGWATAALGLSTRQAPWLSLYVDGCGQAIHNDSAAGQMGYVFSITRWAERTFLGGETLLFRPENYWETDRMTRSGAAASFYDRVESRFNRLLVFDDRVIHGVQPVQGTMDPLRGRVVLHGHLSAGAVAVRGALTPDRVTDRLGPVLDRLRAVAAEHSGRVHGFVTLRVVVAPDGGVAELAPLCDLILPLSSDREPVGAFHRAVADAIHRVTFPPAAGPSEVILPVVVGG